MHIRRLLRLSLLHEAASIFFGGSAYREAIDFDGWYPDADRDRLAIFTAGANAFIQLQIVAHHGNASEHVRAVANQTWRL